MSDSLAPVVGSLGGPDATGNIVGPPPRRQLTPWAILRHSSKLSAATLIGLVLGLPVNILTARLLGPELLGIVGFVSIWQFYGGLCKPGVFSAAYREMPPALAEGKYERAVRLQNIGITSESGYVLLVTGAMLAGAALQRDLTIGIALVIGTIAFILAQVQYFAGMIQWAHERFGLIARANLLSGITSSLFTLAAVWWLRIYALLLAPAVASLTAVLVFRIGAPPSGFRPSFNREEAWRLLKIGLPLSLGGVFYWGFRTVDRTAVTLWLTLADLGYFTFVLQFVNIAIGLVSDFGNVLQPMMWAELTNAGSSRRLPTDARRLVLFVFLGTCAAANFGQAAFGAFVRFFVPNFLPAIAVFNILVFLLACATAAIVPTVLLSSAALNKQNLLPLIWGIGLPVNASLAFVAVRAGLGLNGVALSSVVVQGLVSAVLFYSIRSYLAERPPDQLAFAALMLGILMLAAVVFVLFNLGPFAYEAETDVTVPLILRLLLATGVWGSAGLAAYRGWRSQTSRGLSNSL